jgi:hypothetical protein
VKVGDSASFVPAAHFEVVLVVLVVFRFQLKRIEGDPMAVSNLFEGANLSASLVGNKVGNKDEAKWGAKFGVRVDLRRSIFYRVVNHQGFFVS